MNMATRSHWPMRCLLILSTALLTLAPVVVWAGEPLPPDHPLVQQAMDEGTATAAAYLARRRLSARAGQAPGPPSRPGTGSIEAPGGAPREVEATVEGFTAYSMPGLSLIVQIPQEWELTQEVSDGYFGFRIPGEFSYSFFNTLGKEDFPGLLGLTIFNTRADLLVEQMGENMALDQVESFTTEQGLPVVKIGFSGSISSIDISGGFYLFTNAQAVYGLVIVTNQASWPGIETQMDLVARNLIFTDNQERALVQAADGDLAYTSSKAGLSLILPQGWLLQETGQDALPLSVADADLKVTGVLATVTPTEANGLARESLRTRLLEAGSEPSAKDLQNIVEELFADAEINFGSGDFTADPELLTVFPGEHPTVRYGGEGDFGEFNMPVLFYLDVRPEMVALGLFFGEEKALMEANDLLVNLVRSVAPVVDSE